MIVRKTCCAKLFLLSIIPIIFEIRIAFCDQLQACGNGQGLCQHIDQCKWFQDSSNIVYSKLNWCNAPECILCCPQFHPPIPAPKYYEQIKAPYAEDCKRWQKDIYNRCPPQGLIVSGDRALPKEFPHMALIGILKTDKYRWLCGGMLINPRYVLTAAHCMEATEIPNVVRLGELDYNRTDDDALVQEFKIKDYTSHPDYDSEEFYDDIAVIELDGIAVINDYVVPICLPATNGNEHDRLYAAGWGAIGNAREASTYLQWVKLERFSSEFCQKVTGVNDELSEGVKADYQICAGSTQDDGRDTCQGDSGGPLFIEHPDLPCMYLVHGVTSFSSICGPKNIPGVYTRVYAYVNWIQSVAWNSTLRI